MHFFACEDSKSPLFLKFASCRSTYTFGACLTQGDVACSKFHHTQLPSTSDPKGEWFIFPGPGCVLSGKANNKKGSRILIKGCCGSTTKSYFYTCEGVVNITFLQETHSSVDRPPLKTSGFSCFSRFCRDRSHSELGMHLYSALPSLGCACQPACSQQVSQIFHVATTCSSAMSKQLCNTKHSKHLYIRLALFG